MRTGLYNGQFNLVKVVPGCGIGRAELIRGLLSSPCSGNSGLLQSKADRRLHKISGSNPA